MWWILSGGMCAIAVIASMLGQGGGMLYTPLQVWMGSDLHQAAATSLFLIMVTSAAASLVFFRANRIDWPLAIALETVTTVGAFAGGVGADWLSGATLSLLFALLTSLAAVFMILPLKQRPRTAGGGFAGHLLRGRWR